MSSRAWCRGTTHGFCAASANAHMQASTGPCRLKKSTIAGADETEAAALAALPSRSASTSAGRRSTSSVSPFASRTRNTRGGMVVCAAHGRHTAPCISTDWDAGTFASASTGAVPPAPRWMSVAPSCQAGFTPDAYVSVALVAGEDGPMA